MTTCIPQIRSITAEQTYELRHAVLWPDKPPDYVKLDDDATGHHFGAFYEDELVAVISLFVAPDTTRPDGAVVDGSPAGRFRKFATRPDRQRQGIGTHLLNHVIAEARGRGAVVLWCDARLESTDFYRRFGMQPEGIIFHKGTIPYTRMSRPLA